MPCGSRQKDIRPNPGSSGSGASASPPASRTNARRLVGVRHGRCEHTADPGDLGPFTLRVDLEDFRRLAALLIDEVVHASVINHVERKFAILSRSYVDAFSMKFRLVRLARTTAEQLLILSILVLCHGVERFLRL